jgi:hypothetical protein
VFAVAIPGCILAVCALVGEKWAGNPGLAVERWSVPLLVAYSVVAYCLGYTRFKHLEAVDGTRRELTLPAGLQDFVTWPFAVIGARFRGPFAALLKKELRLQQISFMLAGLFVLISLLGLCFWSRKEAASLILGSNFVIYLVILPLVAGPSRSRRSGAGAWRNGISLCRPPRLSNGRRRCWQRIQ